MIFESESLPPHLSVYVFVAATKSDAFPAAETCLSVKDMTSSFLQSEKMKKQNLNNAR